ncbi:hypothetical protein ACS0TY_030789 [Phlomoides rotata]
MSPPSPPISTPHRCLPPIPSVATPHASDATPFLSDFNAPPPIAVVSRSQRRCAPSAFQSSSLLYVDDSPSSIGNKIKAPKVCSVLEEQTKVKESS